MEALPDELNERGVLGPYETSHEALSAAVGAAFDLPRSGWRVLRPRFTHDESWYVLDDDGRFTAAGVVASAEDGWYALSATTCASG